MATSPTLTICIPVGPGHEPLFARASESVKAQTIPVLGIALPDTEGKGAGWARNQLLAKVTTPYVSFLDCDDWLKPDFAEQMLMELDADHYTYSAWYQALGNGQESVVIPSAECYCFQQDNWWKVHLINAVIPTQWMRDIGGFDETLPGMEDTDAFHRLHAIGHCGKLVNKPLVHYADDGKRSQEFRNHPDYLSIKQAIGARYNKTEMPCCQGQGVSNQGPFGEKQPGDVLARVLGPNFQTYVGRQSDRLYNNVGYGQLVWADPRDVASDPARFQRVEQTHTPNEVISSSAEIATLLQSQVQPGLAQQPTREPAPGRKKVSDLKKMAGIE